MPDVAKVEKPDQDRQRMVFVTGPSGAGRSTAVNALEDIGYEAIDNLPLSLLARLLDGPPLARPLALGIDVRNRDFSANGFIEIIDTIGCNGRNLMLSCYIWIAARMC